MVMKNKKETVIFLMIIFKHECLCYKIRHNLQNIKMKMFDEEISGLTRFLAKILAATKMYLTLTSAAEWVFERPVVHPSHRRRSRIVI